MISLIVRLGPLLIVTVFVASILRQFFRNYHGSDRRLSQDVSHRNLPVPVWALGAAGQLLSLGFVRLGETETYLPAKPHIGIIWHFSNADRTVTVEVMGQKETGVLLNFFSVFTDASVVETGYPSGENINDQRFHSHRVTTSLEGAYQHQLDQIAAWQMGHGSPQRIEDMADLLRWEGIYRANFGKRKLMSWFLRNTSSFLIILLVTGLATIMLEYKISNAFLWLILSVLIAVLALTTLRWRR